MTSIQATTKLQSYSSATHIAGLGLAKYANPDKVLETLLELAKNTSPGDLARVSKPVLDAFFSYATLSVAKDFVKTLMGNAKYGPLVAGIITFAREVSKSKPLAAGTLIEAADRLMDLQTGLNNQQIKMLAQVANARLNPNSISNGNCGDISTKFWLNSRVVAERRDWTTSPSPFDLEKRIASQGQKLTRVEIASSRDKAGEISDESVQAVFNQIDMSLRNSRISKFSQLNGISPSAANPSVKIFQTVPEGSAQEQLKHWKTPNNHSVNIVRLKGGMIAIVDIQSNEIAVGESNVKLWIKNHTPFHPRVNIKFIIYGASR